MKYLEDVMKLQKEYKRLYNEDKFLGISNNYIHLNFKSFLDTFEFYEVTVREESEYPYEFETTVEDFRFIAITDKEELEKYKGGK